MVTPVGVGVVGLSAFGGWAAAAHAPAIRAVDGLQLRAVAASSVESARRAAERHGVAGAFGSVAELAAQDDVDLVVIAVKVPRHRELVLAALAAGKPVLCEWPLATNLVQAEELHAAAQGVRSFVGLQGRSSPDLRWLAALVADGYVGEVLSSTISIRSSEWGGPVSEQALYTLHPEHGATMLTIPFAHAVDALAMALGEPLDVSATTATRRPQVPLDGSGRTVSMTAEDQIAVTGMLPGGAVFSIHHRGGTAAGAGFAWVIDGTDGTLEITSASGYPHIGPVVIRGARTNQPFTTLRPPVLADHYRELSQPARSVAHQYEAVHRDLTDGTAHAPDFAHALTRHRLLDAIARSAATGRRTSGSATHAYVGRLFAP